MKKANKTINDPATIKAIITKFIPSSSFYPFLTFNKIIKLYHNYYLKHNNHYCIKRIRKILNHI